MMLRLQSLSTLAAVALALTFATPAVALNVCDVGPNVCPTGYHPTEYRCDLSQCSGPCAYDDGYNNLTVCQPDVGPEFTRCFECDPQCPTWWSLLSATTSSECDAGPIGPCFGPHVSGNEAVCRANPPAFSYQGGEGASCGDLGTTHVNPDFLVKYTVRGRPGAQVWKYDRHASCGSWSWSLAPESPMTIPPSGTLEFAIENTASSDCSSSILGRWQSFVRVDNVSSTYESFTYYNSNCVQTSTCSKAGTFCP